MRLRYVKGATELIASHPDIIINDVDHTSLPLETLFPNSNPLHIEIGMGKGQFLYTMAKHNPNINYLGIEKFDSAIVKALYKLIDSPLPNIMLLRAEAEYLESFFPIHSLERIYLNFSDPWPKVRHEKRRLTNPRFLQRYQSLLVKSGEIHFKTDNVELFDYSVETMTQFGMEILDQTRHLHQTSTDIVTTEFEDKFKAEGKPIHKLVARFKEETHG